MDKYKIQVGDRVIYRYVNEEEQKQERIAVNMDEIFWLGNTDKEILKIERIGSNGWYTVYEKKDLLTDEEREFLKAFKNISRQEIEGVEIDSDKVLTIHRERNYTSYIPTNKFKNLKKDKWYTLKELGLEEEV